MPHERPHALYAQQFYRSILQDSTCNHILHVVVVTPLTMRSGAYGALSLSERPTMANGSFLLCHECLKKRFHLSYTLVPGTYLRPHVFRTTLYSIYFYNHYRLRFAIPAFLRLSLSHPFSRFFSFWCAPQKVRRTPRARTQEGTNSNQPPKD